MAIRELHLYVTRVVNGVVSADSVFTTISIDDANNDGKIDRSEWSTFTGSPNGHIAGETSPPALFWGDGNGVVLNGRLYSVISYPAGTNLRTLLKDLDKSGYAPSVTDLNICYLAGTLIQTPEGEVPVERLRAGDLVQTADHGAMQVLWAGQSEIDARLLDADPSRRAIRIEAGALGEGLPRRAVLVSAQHRIVWRDADGVEKLISARHLLKANAPGVSVATDLDAFTLVHIAFAKHEVIFAEGAAMESFYTGPMAIRGLAPDARRELFDVFPQLGLMINPMTPARPIVSWKDYRATSARKDRALL